MGKSKENFQGGSYCCFFYLVTYEPVHKLGGWNRLLAYVTLKWGQED